MCSCLMAVVFVIFCLPETKGKTLEKISQFFGQATVKEITHSAGILIKPEGYPHIVLNKPTPKSKMPTKSVFKKIRHFNVFKSFKFQITICTFFSLTQT